MPRLVLPAAVRIRSKIWELNGSIHCSIIGTCLTTAELRRVMDKVLPGGVAHASDHDLHAQAVGLCSHQGAAAKLLQKALDHRHEIVVKRFSRLSGGPAVLAAWAEARAAGDIPGAYWAVLTHPDSGHEVLRRAFGDVHMLSHLVGAANRADLRRLAELEGANARLQATIERQQARLHEEALAGGRAARALQDALSRQAVPAPAEPDGAEVRVLRGAVQELRRRLDAGEQRSTGLGTRLADALAALATEQAARGEAERRAELVQAELAAAEAALAGDRAERSGWPALAGVSVLYVGGRPHGVAVMQGLAEGMGAAFAHHDGGVEDGTGLLPGLVGRADLVIFPVDCVSHEAALAIKRLCRHAGKTFLPLRSAGVGSFLAALRLLPAPRQTAA